MAILVTSKYEEDPIKIELKLLPARMKKIQ